MNSIQRLVIIGSGNVATHLAMAFQQAGLNVCGIYSRTLENAQVLADKLSVKVFKSVDEIIVDADAYLLAVSDSALPEIIKDLPALDGVLMHTSGSVGLDVFPEQVKRSAVFYPLQTFSKEKQIDYSIVPILLESEETAVLDALHLLGKKISKTVRTIDSKQRKQLHLSAVFMCNFSNYMFHISERLLKENDLDFELLKPLLDETIEKLDVLSPAEAQTGPAIRNDEKTLSEHLEMLKNHPEYQFIYQLISAQIQKIKN
jgi:predicted short-subunit dehydrogenase-like oxidoreductase (DUF2520 family)